MRGIMKFTIFCILSCFCVFHVNSNTITDLKAVAEQESQNIADYDQKLNSWILLTYSNLHGVTTDALAKSWKATLDLRDILTGKVKTQEGKDCIVSEINKFRQIVETATFKLYACTQDPSKIGESTRKKIQRTHQECLKIQDDINEVMNTCGTKPDQPEEECIALRVDELESSIKVILDQVKIHNIEADTIKSKVLLHAMLCNAKILSEVHKSITTIQDTLKKCPNDDEGLSK